jgi:hypothetical protein
VSRFVILCVNRTGSSHLAALLDSHPGISCLPEIFAPPGENVPAHYYARAGIADPREYLAWVTRLVAGPVVGFKLPWPSLAAWPDALTLMRDPALGVIRLKRGNRLAQVASSWLARESGSWHSIWGDYGGARITVEPERLLRALTGAEFSDAVLDELAIGGRTFDLTYEELAAGDRLEDLQRWLGVAPVELRSEHRKLRRFPLDEAIENWDEVEAALRGTRFERYLDPAAA